MCAIIIKRSPSISCVSTTATGFTESLNSFNYIDCPNNFRTTHPPPNFIRPSPSSVYTVIPSIRRALQSYQMGCLLAEWLEPIEVKLIRLMKVYKVMRFRYRYQLISLSSVRVNVFHLKICSSLTDLFKRFLFRPSLVSSLYTLIMFSDSFVNSMHLDVLGSAGNFGLQLILESFFFPQPIFFC